MAATQTSASLPLWWEACRPRTLPASIAPVIVGTAASVPATCGGSCPGLDVGRVALALTVALSLQIAVNFANDYFDGVGGVDTDDRVGPRRLVASELVSPKRMRLAMLVALAIGGLAGLALAAMAGWELLIVGLAALLAAVGYSGGPRPYASAGLGEVFVFVFFGVVATAGSAYVQDETLRLLPLLASIPMGLLATALLVVNNLRDIPTDSAVGKVTLAVRLGDQRTRRLFGGLLFGSYLIAVATILPASSGWTALPLVTIPMGYRAWQTVRDRHGPELIAALGQTAQLQIAFAALFALGLFLRGAGG